MGFRELKKKMGLKLVTFALVKVFKDLSEGKYGPSWKARYEFARGKTTWTGLGLVILGVVVAAYGPPEAASWVAGAGGFLASVGLVKKGYHEEIPAEVANAVWYRFLAQHGFLVGGILVTASAYLKAPADCSWCLVIDKVVFVLGLVAAELKLVDPAWKEQPPIDLKNLSHYLEDEQ